MKTIKHKRFFIPDNVLELFFGLGASVVIVGALLKITHGDFIFSGNVWLTAGLITEAVIFGISGVKGYMTIDPDGFESGDDIETLEVETHELAKAVATSINKITKLNEDLTAASKSIGSLHVPSDMNAHMSEYNANIHTGSVKLEEINKLYESLSSHLNEVNASTSEMHVPEGLNEELATMKNKVASLNAKYKGMLSAMNN
jgi:archaellum component FlaC